jgi:hypothetical protein
MLRFLLTLTAVCVVTILAIAYVIDTARDRIHPTVATLQSLS